MFRIFEPRRPPMPDIGFTKDEFGNPTSMTQSLGQQRQQARFDEEEKRKKKSRKNAQVANIVSAAFGG